MKISWACRYQQQPPRRSHIISTHSAMSAGKIQAMSMGSPPVRHVRREARAESYKESYPVVPAAGPGAQQVGDAGLQESSLR